MGPKVALGQRGPAGRRRCQGDGRHHPGHQLQAPEPALEPVHGVRGRPGHLHRPEAHLLEGRRLVEVHLLRSREGLADKHDPVEGRSYVAAAKADRPQGLVVGGRARHEPPVEGGAPGLHRLHHRDPGRPVVHQQPARRLARRPAGDDGADPRPEPEGHHLDRQREAVRLYRPVADQPDAEQHQGAVRRQGRPLGDLLLHRPRQGGPDRESWGRVAVAAAACRTRPPFGRTSTRSRTC